MNAGRAATVVQNPGPVSIDEFLAHLDGDPRSWHCRILPDEVVQILPAPDPPTWMAAVELRAAADLDRLIVSFCEDAIRQGKWAVDSFAFFEVIRFIWSMRLPLEREDLDKLLEGHGVPGTRRKQLLNFFKAGRNLLIYSAGKKPIKKRRANPVTGRTDTRYSA
jgi:hypothetical protein